MRLIQTTKPHSVYDMCEHSFNKIYFPKIKKKNLQYRLYRAHAYFIYIHIYMYMCSW